MEISSIYLWKEINERGAYELTNSENYTLVDIRNINLSFISSFFKSDVFIIDFFDRYQKITISNIAKNLINELLKKNIIEGLEIEFYLLSAIFQKEYINYYEDTTALETLVSEDFQNEGIDLEPLLDILYFKLKNGNTILKSVRLNTKGRSVTIDNFFIVEEIFNLLILKYDLTIENFEKRRVELIGNTNNLKLDSLDEYTKWILADGLYNYIAKDERSKNLNKNFKFVGSFMHICQIPIKKRTFEIPFSNDVNELISTEEIKYLNGFITRPNSFFVNKVKQ